MSPVAGAGLSYCMIAATALDDDAALATANVADFRRLEELGLSLMLVD